MNGSSNMNNNGKSNNKKKNKNWILGLVVIFFNFSNIYVIFYKGGGKL